MTTIHIDPAAAEPIFRQIAEQFRRLIALGALKTGDRLPTVRELAVQLRVNRNTAARAIRHLENEGIVETRVGRGTFVTTAPSGIDPALTTAILDRRLDDLLVEAHTLGFPLHQLIPRLTDRTRRFEERRKQEENES